MTSPLPHLPDVTRLSPALIRILGHNPSKFTLQGTNTYLLGSGPSRLLIDTGEGKPEWRDSLRQVLGKERASVGKVLLTHWHPDHVGGVKDVQELCSSGEVEVRKFDPDPSAGQKGIHDGEVIEVEGARIRAVHSPGHTTDHCAFLLEGEGALFSGDNVLGHGTAVFEDLATYVASLHKMRDVIGFTSRIFPGHGEVVEDGKGKVVQYIEHRAQREREVLGVLVRKREDGDGEGWGSAEMTRVVYKGYPEALMGPAEGSLKGVLEKLEKDGRVREAEGRWSLIEGKEKL